MLNMPDGTYEVQVVDAEDRDDGSLNVQVAVTTGPRKGETTWIENTTLELSSFQVLGLLGTLNVEGGVPTLDL